MAIKKYVAVFTITIQEYFAYRLNFILWRLRVMIEFIIPLFLWLSVINQTKNFNGYNQKTILDYFFYTHFISFFILGTRTIDIAGQIQNGEIINLLLKPISFFKYYLVRDLADKFFNLVFGLVEVIAIYSLFGFSLPQPQFSYFFLMIVFLIIGFFISFFVNLAISFVGFWSPEVWAPRFVFMILSSILSGIYFPLDLLPKKIFDLFLLSPFPYYFFIPIRLLTQPTTILAKTSVSYLLSIGSFWVIATFFLTYWLWQKGIKSFSFWGR